MPTVSPHDGQGLPEAYALDALDAQEKSAFEGHLAGCSDCAAAVEGHRALLHDVLSSDPTAPRPELRNHVLEFMDAPSVPLDVSRYTWEEVVPGVRMTTVFEDSARKLRKALVWAKPGSCYPTHRHLGQEEILVLEGALGDHRGVYRPGDICRSAEGSVHSESVVGGEDCVCFIVYHGGHELLPE